MPLTSPTLQTTTGLETGSPAPPVGVTVSANPSARMALREQFPLRCLIGQEDVTFLLDNGFTFSSVDPGGFEMCALHVPKDMPNTLRGMPVRIDCGLGVAWEGRVSEVQRSLGSSTAITGEGYGAVLKDQAVAQIFVDRDLTYWSGPSVQSQINLVNTGFSPASGQVAADPTSGNPAIALLCTGPWTTGGLPQIVALYDGQGVPLATLYVQIVFGPGTSGFGVYAELMTDDVGSQIDFSLFTSNGSGVCNATGSNRTYASLQCNYPGGPAGGSNVQYGAFAENVAVYGNHGLHAQYGPPGGFYPSQIAGWAQSQVSGLQAGVIPVTDASNYIVPHCVYYSPVGLDQMVDDMAKIAGWHWGVWPSLSPLTGNPQPRLDFRPRPPQGTYTASCLRSDCEACDIREDLAGMYDTAIVSYTNVDGTSRNATVTLANPVLELAGLHRTVELAGGTSTAAAATTFGLIALNLLYTQARVSGTVTISTAINSMAGPMPAWMLRPGIDRLRINDLPSADAFGQYNDVPLTRVECSGSSSGFSTSLEVGAGADLVETLQARLTAAAALAAQG